MKDEKDNVDILAPPEADLPGDNGFDHDHREELLLLTRMLHDMPLREPPSDLVEAVSRSIKPKKIPAWRRLLIWASTPQSITVSPIKLIPASAAGVAICLAIGLTIYSLTMDQRRLGLHQQEQRLIPAIFTFHAPHARAVSLIGSFNNWNPIGSEMHLREDGNVWVLELRLQEGRHEYAFFVDGELVVPDPNSTFSQSDGFGNHNSIIFVTESNARNI